MTLENLSYPDFVAYIGQENSPPGGECTIGLWVEIGGISARSYVLDLACSTGLSGRTIAQMAGCRVVGIDLSRIAIDTARAKSEQSRLDTKYHRGDAARLQYDEGTFSHIVCGSAFGFFDQRRLVLEECRRVLEPGGRLCIATFYYISPPPAALVEKVNSTIGGNLTRGSTLELDNQFFASRFDLEWQKLGSLPVLSAKQIAASCYSEMCAARDIRSFTDKEFDIALQRLVYTRLIFNEHRRYQGTAVQLWRLGNG